MISMVLGGGAVHRIISGSRNEARKLGFPEQHELGKFVTIENFTIQGVKFLKLSKEMIPKIIQAIEFSGILSKYIVRVLH